MGWKEFLASVINSLAWPAAIAVVFVLRVPLRQALPRAQEGWVPRARSGIW
jgi:hypothetical protein